MVCEFCNKKFKEKYGKRNLKKHILYCRLNPDRFEYNCKYCGKEEETVSKLGSHVSNCIQNPDYTKILEIRKQTGSKHKHKHTPETKKKLSEIRIKYLTENPDKVPYLLNHSSKESYPEKYFTDLFLKENVKVEKFYQIGLYELDFCIPEKKIDIEIDGEQHFCDVKIVESDIKRTEFLEENGWKVIRIRWSKFQKLSYEEKIKYISDLKNYIENKSEIPKLNETEKILIKKTKNKNKTEEGKQKSICEVCNSNCTSGKKICQKCYKFSKRKVQRPPLEILLSDVDELGYSATGRKYGVSDNAIRKWIKNYKRTPKL